MACAVSAHLLRRFGEAMNANISGKCLVFSRANKSLAVPAGSGSAPVLSACSSLSVLAFQTGISSWRMSVSFLTNAYASAQACDSAS